MFTMQKTLVHSIDFDNAMFFLIKVSVWKDGVQVSEGGFVDGYNKEAVVVNGEYYTRNYYEFRSYPTMQNVG